MSNWKEVPLDLLYEFRSGLSKSRTEFGTGHPFLSFKDVFYNIFVPDELTELVNSTDRERESCSIIRGDVFLTRTSETLEELGMSCVALRDYESATFNGFTKRLRPKSASAIVPEYAGYFFRSPKFRRSVTAMSSMSTRASLNNEMLARLTITVPSKEEQVAIGCALKSLDDKIELNRRMNETLEAIFRAIFKSWFIDFDPVRAKAEGRDTGFPKHIDDLFPGRFVDSEIGWIPSGWSLRQLHEVLTPKNDRVGDIEVPVYSSTNDGLQLRSKIFKKQLSQSLAKNKLIHYGDMVFGLSRRVLSFGLMRDTIGCVSPAYKVFSIEKDSIFPDLLERMMRIRSNYFYNAISASSREGQSLSSEGLGLLKFVQPSMDVQKMFYDTVRLLLSRVEKLWEESQRLGALRDTLLPKLISGELSLQDVIAISDEGA